MTSKINLMALPAALVALFGTASLALAQTVENAPQQTAPTDAAIPSLMFFTLGVGLILALGVLALFLSNRSNREATNRVVNPNHPSNK